MYNTNNPEKVIYKYKEFHMLLFFLFLFNTCARIYTISTIKKIIYIYIYINDIPSFILRNIYNIFFILFNVKAH